MESYSIIIMSPIGDIEVKFNDNFVLSVHFVQEYENIILKLPSQDNTLLNQIKEQFEDYFLRKRFDIDLPHYEFSNKFRDNCFEKVKQISYGTTKSYKGLAIELGNENSSRAVGNALNRNPIPLLIPCHRVIATNCNLSGFRYGT